MKHTYDIKICILYETVLRITIILAVIRLVLSRNFIKNQATIDQSCVSVPFCKVVLKITIGCTAYFT